MSIIHALIISTIAGMSTLLGSIFIFLKIDSKNINKFITICLSFSIAIMIGISITDLIPSSFFYIMKHYPFFTGLPIILATFIIGCIFILLINKMLKYESNSLYKLGILSMIALILHNFPEGIATFMSSIKDTDLGIKLSLAIMFHNIPEGISIAIPIYYATKSKKKAIIHTLLSGLAEPLGAILAYIFLKNYINDLILSITLILVAGIMISLAINEMLKEALSYNENKYIYIGLSLGIILLILNIII